MELICAWWNCRLTPPKNGAKSFSETAGFSLAVCELLRRGVDVLGLCEVASTNVLYLEGLLKSEGFDDYSVLDLYSPGRSIDDFCLIFNSKKLRVLTAPQTANARDHLTNDWLKAGVFVSFELAGVGEIFIGLSHWQSRQTYAEGSSNRFKLGQALREKAKEIFTNSPQAAIILLGDYNDEPYHSSIVSGLGASRDPDFVRRRPHYFYNPYWRCLGGGTPETPYGSYVHPTAVEASGGAVYDQIMFSSHFVNHWTFERPGLIVGDIPVAETSLKWSDVSDHYPILSHLKRIEL
ncbi:endonuclease/exonuclease/phosphatase family protein [Achromobacter spanius]|uniref:endonuclease/exonuclease/phosphatase family protein n=1 Tax=Achromobacter spanius TaxID=217203 RepID=UPI000F8F888E|nr:endonuclease/exonuclease/phosphatase family protein [Achromobacter spanius]AZS81767.1 endonuclease/exonuclease/phosphatase family protein [Achromobacter spanius]